MSDIADALGGVDLNDVKPVDTFEPLPAGWYTVEIEGAEVKDTKAGDKRLAIKMTVMTEPYTNRKLFGSIMLKHKNPKVVEIGHRELAGLCEAIGNKALQDCTELIGKVVETKIIVRVREGMEPNNEVKSYRAIGGTQTTAPVATKPVTVSAPVSKPAPATAGKHPWEK
jgi:hypothetical protein